MKHTNPSTESLSRACPRVVQFHFHTLCSTWWTCSFLKQQCLSSTLSLHVIPRHSPVTPGRPALYTTTRSEFGRTTPGRLFILVFMQKGRIFCFVSFSKRSCMFGSTSFFVPQNIHPWSNSLPIPPNSVPNHLSASIVEEQILQICNFPSFFSPRTGGNYLERRIVVVSVCGP